MGLSYASVCIHKYEKEQNGKKLCQSALLGAVYQPLEMWYIPPPSKNQN